jgi:hypothetical protein
MFVLSLVFPCEVTPQPDVGKTMSTGSLRDAFLKSVRVPLPVNFCWPGLAKNITQVDEMGLRCASFGECAILPSRNEFKHC